MANLNEPRAGCPGGAAGFSRGSAARPSCMRCAIPVHRLRGQDAGDHHSAVQRELRGPDPFSTKRRRPSRAITLSPPQVR